MIVNWQKIRKIIAQYTATLGCNERKLKWIQEVLLIVEKKYKRLFLVR